MKKYIKEKSIIIVSCLVTRLCPTSCNPMVYSLPGSSVHGILQGRILEWVAISFSGGSSRPREQTHVSCTAGRFTTTEPPNKRTISFLQSSFYPLLWCTGFSLQRLVMSRSTGSRHTGFSVCHAWAYLPHSMWGLPGARIEPVSLALAGRRFTTEPKSLSKQ